MPNPTGENLILRWAMGTQDTFKLTQYDEDNFKEMLWLAKLSIVSFQRYFPDAHFMMFYNGFDFEEFIKMFNEMDPILLKDIEFVNQQERLKENNPYTFWPDGVWMKWVPMRVDIDKDEISIDTDIICLNTPHNWYEWIESDKPMLTVPERFKKVCVSTSGDFWEHPLIRHKTPLNCGIVGHKAGHDYSKEFFEITENVRFGATHNSLFITEQGCINIFLRSLQNNGIELFTLDFDKNVWVRDMLYYLESGVKIETVHSPSWHKKILSALKKPLERKVLDNEYDDKMFLGDIIKKSQYFRSFAKRIIRQQIGID